MYNRVEQEMEAGLSDRIDAAIATGIRNGEQRLVRRQKYFRRRTGAAIAVCMLLFLCIFSIRVSPVFAAMIRDIPGFEKFVDLINNSSDKGIRLAMKNNLMQPVGVSDEHDGMKLTVQGIIADESRLVVFYEIRMPNKDESVQFDSPSLTDSIGHRLPASIGFGYPDEAKEDIRKTGIQRGTADFELTQGTAMPGEVVVKLKLKRSGMPKPSNEPRVIAGTENTPVVGGTGIGGTDFQVKIPIDRAKFAQLKREYPIKQSVEIQGQSVNFVKAVVTPLRVSVQLDYGPNNSKQIFGPGDIRLVDDQGTVWRNTGSSGTFYQFESPYYSEPKSLMLEGSWFRALDKNQLSVIIDTEKPRVIQAPDGRLTLYQVTKTNNYTKLDFSLDVVDQEDVMLYSLFGGDFSDADGKVYKMANLQQVLAGYRDSTQHAQHLFYYLDNKSYKQPLTFTIDQYPGYIRQPFKIRIK